MTEIYIYKRYFFNWGHQISAIADEMYWSSFYRLDKPIQERFKLRNLKRFLFYKRGYSVECFEKRMYAILNSIDIIKKATTFY